MRRKEAQASDRKRQERIESKRKGAFPGMEKRPFTSAEPKRSGYVRNQITEKMDAKQENEAAKRTVVMCARLPV